MRTLVFAAIAAITFLGFHNAFALTIDDTTATNGDGSAKFSDPDDAIPFPHVGDNGQMTAPANNFQAPPAYNSGLSFGFTGAPADNGPDAFRRAQENQQQ